MKQLNSDPPWLEACLANIRLLGGHLCDETYCTGNSKITRMVCNCIPPFYNGCPPNNRPPGCCAYTAASPIWMALPNDGCYCCCGSFSDGTPVAISETESEPIVDIMFGDLIYVAEDATLKNWRTETVRFSSGIGANPGESIMIKVDFGTDKEHCDSLYVTPNQAFYMPGGLLKRAQKLVVGVDQLVRADGSTLQVLQLAADKYDKVIHHIATSQSMATSMDGHLILAKGIVCGDYALELASDPALFVKGHNDLPNFGTKEYSDANGNTSG
jgi:hypothetical protein